MKTMNTSCFPLLSCNRSSCTRQHYEELARKEASTFSQYADTYYRVSSLLNVYPDISIKLLAELTGCEKPIALWWVNHLQERARNGAFEISCGVRKRAQKSLS